MTEHCSVFRLYNCKPKGDQKVLESSNSQNDNADDIILKSELLEEAVRILKRGKAPRI